eukprot:scpid76125/ scgid5905/ 
MSGFSFWASNEPCEAVKTDHWAKQRAKTYSLVALPTGGVLPLCMPQIPTASQKASRNTPNSRHVEFNASVQMPPPHERTPWTSHSATVTEHTQPQSQMKYISPYSQEAMRRRSNAARRQSMPQAGSDLFQRYMSHELGATLPEVDSRPLVARQHHRTQSAPANGTGGKRGVMQSEYNERAKQGYRYWYEDKPRRTSKSSKYTMGTHGTVIGIGKTSTF